MSELIVQKPRQSNVELFRILLMLMIIGGHYVMNGGLSHTFDPNHITWQTLFLESFSWEGKMAINGFLLITGFFMCQQIFKIQKFWKLLLMILLYNWGGVHSFSGIRL